MSTTDTNPTRWTKAMRQARLIEVLISLGFNSDEVVQLQRIERALQRWGELECGTGTDRVTQSIERDDAGKPWMRTQFATRSGWQDTKRPVRDTEKSNLAKLADIMAKHPNLSAYHQGDPRGCALYILRPNDVPAGKDPGAYYTRGICVCI